MGLNVLKDDLDLIFLVETWEQDHNRIEDVPGFLKHSIWNQSRGNRGFGGVAVYYRASICSRISIIKENSRKFYMWIHIADEGSNIYLAVCYYPPQKSTTYIEREEEDPYKELGEDITLFQSKGLVFIVGDFNARTSELQAAVLQEGDGPIGLDVSQKKEQLYDRVSQDANGGITFFGEELLYLASKTGLIIANGMQPWPDSGNFTCHTHQGSSVVDYILLGAESISRMTDFCVADLLPESDHNPLYFTLKLQQELGDKGSFERASPLSFIMKEEAKGDYQQYMDDQFKEWVPCGSLCQDFQKFKEVMVTALNKFFPAQKHRKQKKNQSHSRPFNKWFDRECKEARQHLKSVLGKAEERAARSAFKNLLRRKRRRFIWEQQKQLDTLLLKNPKAFWRIMRPKVAHVTGKIDEDKWQEYLQALYHKGDIHPWEISRSGGPQDLFTEDKIQAGITKLAANKAQDELGWVAECLKWAGKAIIPCLQFMFNSVFKEGFPREWQNNLIIPIFKAGDPDLPNNYRTIMVSSLMAKLYSIILERDIAHWTEKRGVRAISQAGFRPKHSTVDHLLTLRVLVEQGKDQVGTIFCCFVDFEKAFDTVPRHLLWLRLKEVGLPSHLLQAAQELYAQVVGIMKDGTHIIAQVACDIGVKQGCPSSPTLFGIYIDKLEGWLAQKGGGGLKLSHLVLFNLLYADDVILFSSTWRSM
eukprot:c28929_g2_i1 orf=1058-3163(+)